MQKKHIKKNLGQHLLKTSISDESQESSASLGGLLGYFLWVHCGTAKLDETGILNHEMERYHGVK